MNIINKRIFTGIAIFVLYSVLFMKQTQAQNVFIPDTNFRAFLNANYPGFMDISGDSLIADSAATLTGELNCSYQNIVDLTGVEYFINITQLSCSDNQLTTLPDLSNNTALQSLDCSSNYQLTTLPDLSNNIALVEIVCWANQLITLPDLSNNIALVKIICWANQLTTLPDLSNNAALERLYCHYNQLTFLPDFSHNTALEGLNCDYNKLDFSDARELRIADTIISMNYFYSQQNPFGEARTFNLCSGDTAVLSIASQDSAISYQWFKGTDTIFGATDTILIIPNITQADAGVYTCKSYGTALLSPPMNWGPGISEFVSEPIILNISTGIATIPFSTLVNIYPNPNNGIFSIVVSAKNKADIGIELIDIIGQLVYKKDIQGVCFINDIIDVSKLAKGIYYLKLKIGQEVKVKKIIVQ